VWDKIGEKAFENGKCYNVPLESSMNYSNKNKHNGIV
jgi:hypothetical protein